MNKTMTALALATLTLGLGLANAQETVTPDAAPDGAPALTKPEKDGMRRGRAGHHGGRGMSEMFALADADKDGALTQAEIDTYRADLVKGADTDGDGNLSIEEFEGIYHQMMRPHMVKAFQRFDQDGDGILTSAEMDARLGNIVSHMDRNDDGKLDKSDRGHKRSHDRKGKQRDAD